MGRRLARWLRGLDRYRAGQAAILAATAVVDIAWIATDRTPPSWDQSHYLWDALQYVDAFRHDGLGGLVQAFFSVERYYGPGYPAFLFPFVLVLGPSAQSGLIANLCLWIVLLLAVGAIARAMFGNAAALIAMAMTALTPFLLVLLHNLLVDIAALTWACVSVAMMLRSRHFTRWLPSALAGAFAGIGLLTKATVLVFLAAPVLVMGLRAAIRLREAPTAQRIRAAANVSLAVAVTLAVAAPWYVVNLDGTLAYLQSATSGELAIGAGPANPLDPTALVALGIVVLNYASWALAAGTGVLGLALLWRRVRGGGPTARARRRTVGGPWAWALVISWALLPLGVLATSRNQDPRYAVVVFPALAIMFAGLAAWTRPRLLAASVVVLVGAVGIGQVAVGQLPPGSDIRDRAVLNIATGPTGNAALFGPAYEAPNPNGDVGTPVMQALERLTGGRPAHVLLAQDDYVFNVNTLKLLAYTRHDGLAFEEPNQLTGDPSELDGYKFALYIPASAVAQRNPLLRLQLLNQATAGAVFGDRLFAVFGRSRHQVALDGGATAWVLER